MNIDFDISKEKIRDKVIKNFSQRDFEGEEFLPFLKGESQSIIINRKIFYLLIIFLLLFVFSIVLRLIDLQIIRGDYYLGVAKRNEVRIEPIKAQRGIIYDRHLTPLLKNVPKFSLFVIPKEVPQNNKEFTIKKIASILNEKENNLIDLVNSDFDQPILFKESLSYEQALLFEIEKENLPGIILKIEPGREYLAGQEFSHLLGYTGKISLEELEKEKDYSYSDEIGKIGLEKHYEKILRGQDGKKKVEIDSKGREIVVAQEKEKDGENIVLTIDLEFQKKLAEALTKQIRISGAKKGAAVILNPKNGEILALVSYPYFDNNLFSRGLSQRDFEKIVAHPDKPLFFRAISGQYPPGSTIKPILALAALEEGIINEQTAIVSKGGIKIGKEFFSDWKKEGHGVTQVKKALAESVNTFFYLVGGGSENFRGLGPEKIKFYLEKFGLGKKTNLDLPAEKDGFLPSPEWKKRKKNEEWYIGDSYNLSIGHGDIVATPLQIAYLTGLIVNEGKIYQPHLLKKGQEFEENKFVFQFKKENFKVVKEGLREAILYGTAKALNDLTIKVAGKTGTVEVGQKKPHSWFTCFAPYEDPQIVLTVIVENGGEGSGPALRVAKEFFIWLADKMNK